MASSVFQAFGVVLARESSHAASVAFHGLLARSVASVVALWDLGPCQGAPAVAGQLWRCSMVSFGRRLARSCRLRPCRAALPCRRGRFASPSRARSRPSPCSPTCWRRVAGPSRTASQACRTTYLSRHSIRLRASAGWRGSPPGSAAPCMYLCAVPSSVYATVSAATSTYHELSVPSAGAVTSSISAITLRLVAALVPPLPHVTLHPHPARRGGDWRSPRRQPPPIASASSLCA